MMPDRCTSVPVSHGARHSGSVIVPTSFEFLLSAVVVSGSASWLFPCLEFASFPSGFPFPGAGAEFVSCAVFPLPDVAFPTVPFSTEFPFPVLSPPFVCATGREGAVPLSDVFSFAFSESVFWVLAVFSFL